MKVNLSTEQKLKMLDTVFMDDYEYDSKFIAQMTDEEYERFLKLCPEFEEKSEWAKERKRKKESDNKSE